VLILDDGTAISETMAICRYFDETKPEPAPVKSSPPAKEVEPQPEHDALLDRTESVVSKMLHLLDLQAQVSAHYGLTERDGRRNIQVDIRGSDLSVLIGRRSETLSAFQYVASLIIGKETGQFVQLTVDVEGYRPELGQVDREVRAALETVEATGRQALTEMRRLVGLLREQGAMPEFAPQPSMRTLGVLLSSVREAGFTVDLVVEGEPRELPPGVDLSAYRVVQEALTNALEFAGRAHTWVTVRWGKDELELELANAGDVDGVPNGAGHGLIGIKERVSLYGGSITSGPRQGGGFVVTAHLPLEARA
jgi:signal transduction histidine kinase